MKGTIKLSRVYYRDYDDEEVEYCRGTGISSEGYKTRYECEKLVINEILNKYNNRMPDTLKNIAKYETFISEHTNRLNEIK